MQKHKVIISAPDEMTGQDVAMAIESALEYVVVDCRECADNCPDPDDIERFNDKADYYDKLEVCEDEG